VHRGLGSLGALAVLFLFFTSAAAASGLGAGVTVDQTTFSSATLQLEGTTGSNHCYSTGTGSGGTVSANSMPCANGSPVPSGALSSTSSSSATTTLGSPGTANAAVADMASASCGVAELSDAEPATDWSGTGPDTALPLGGVTYQASGPLGTQAITTDGSTGWAETTTEYTNPETFTILVWFETSTDQGFIAGFGNNQTVPSSDTNNDRMLWVDPTGHLVWAVYNNANDEVTSSSAYANGAWHFVAASVGSAGQKLYVDGGLAGSSSNTAAQSYSGWWAIGLSKATAVGGWADTPSSAYFEGSIAQLAIIPSQLTATQVSNLYADSTLTTYAAGVAALSPANYWALNDSGSVAYEGPVPGATASTALADASGNANTGTAEGGVTLGATGPPALAAGGVSFNGSSGYVETATSYANPEGTSEVAWFKTSGANGGTVMGFTTAQGDGAPVNYDRTVWVDDAGKLVFGVYYNSSAYEVTSPAAYNNSAWHMVVAEIGSSGMQLWVDGTEVGSNSSVTSAQNYTGYWHLGWGSETYSWADPPASSFLSGSLSEAAIVPTQLTASQISTLYNAGSTTAFTRDMGQLSPTSYWPLQDSASNVCGTSEITVQQTVASTNTCIFPSAAGTCPAPAATYLTTALGARSITAPSSATPVTVTITMKLSAASPAGVLGLHELADISFGTSKSPWSAQIAYPSAGPQL
jgi:hypothetical protein